MQRFSAIGKRDRPVRVFAENTLMPASVTRFTGLRTMIPPTDSNRELMQGIKSGCCHTALFSSIKRILI
jgi:hypothetical protein